MPVEIGYWAIRGLAEPCRLLLHYTETGIALKTFLILLSEFREAYEPTRAPTLI